MVKHLVMDDDGTVRPAVTYAVIGLVVVVGGWFAWRAFTSDSGPLERGLKCTDDSCGYAVKRELKVGESIPANCPQCGKPTLVPTRPCPNCGTPVILNDYRGLAPPTKCPKCGQEVWHGM